MLLHGAGDSAGTWSSTVKTFTPRYRVVVPDLAGHGMSAPAEGPISVGQVLEGLEAVMAHHAACLSNPSCEESNMEFDIVINGGGLVGASFAAALSSSGLKIALVEGQALPELDSGWDCRIYAFTPGNVDFLKQSGAWQRLDTARVQQVEEMRVFDDTGAELDLSAYQAVAPELAFILESRLLQHALWEGLREQQNLTILQPAQCAELNINDEAAHLKLKDGREIKAKLIIGADGRDSWVRNQTIMPEVPTPYFQHGVVANFNISKAHRGIAYQWFMPDGILALLPLPGKRISIVWSVSPEKSAELLALT